MSEPVANWALRFPAVGAGLAASLAVLLVGAAVDQAYFAHGITVSWRQNDPAITEGPRDFELARTVEHRIAFESSHRPLARYVQHWDYARLPPPMTPPIDALVIARLDVPPGPPLFVGARASGRTNVLVDGAPVPSTGLSPGRHWLEVWWHDPHPGRTTSFELLWGSARDALDPIPREHLQPAIGAWPFSRIAFAWGVVVLALVVGGLAARIVASDGPDRRRWIERSATAAILGLALALRLFDYDVMPQYLENGDELFALWNGWSILHEGTPRGWTLWPGSYAGQPITMTLLSMHGVEWHVIEPYFEHPPLLHLLVGAAATLGGADHWSHTRLVHGRLVPIVLSTLSTWLVLLLSRRLDTKGRSNSPAPYLSSLLYAALPTIAIQGRVIKEEAALTPLALGAVLSFLRWRDDGRRPSDALLAAAMAGACMLAKVTGFAVLAAIVLLLLMERASKVAFGAGALGVAVASLFPVFGAIVNWQVFVETQRLQGGRPTHFNLFLRFFDDGMINMTLIGRGWLLFLWLATAATAFTRPRRDVAALLVVPLFYMAAIGLGAGNWFYGWYIAPILPFLCVGAGRFLADLWERPDFVRGALFSLTAVMYGFNFLLDPVEAKQASHWPEIRRHVTALLAAMLGPFALSTAFPRALVIGRAMVAVWVAALVSLSSYFVVRYEVFYDRYRDFDRDAYFDR